MIYHIYWGTAGNAGLYLDEIYQSLKKAGYQQKVFVSYYYPFDYGEKVFFKRTEMEHCPYSGVRRRVMQALELFYALVKIYISARKNKPQLVNYSYVSKGNRLILLFLNMIKRINNCKLVITCHDVVPFAPTEVAYNKELSIKTKIYSLADAYLIHNDNSRKDLIRLFNINEDKIFEHPFPLMDLSKLSKNEKYETIQYDFLFIGHMRKEKGVDILVKAWQKLHGQYPKARLCIAGNPLYYKDYLLSEKELLNANNVELKLGFINDNDYLKLVNSSRCVVFPYTGGTNSGVISTVMSVGRDVITSDIGMFSNSTFVPKENMFITGDEESLFEKMVAYLKGQLVSDSKERIGNYRSKFDEQVEKSYKQIIEKNKY